MNAFDDDSKVPRLCENSASLIFTAIFAHESLLNGYQKKVKTKVEHCASD